MANILACFLFLSARPRGCCGPCLQRTSPCLPAVCVWSRTQGKLQRSTQPASDMVKQLLLSGICCRGSRGEYTPKYPSSLMGNNVHIRCTTVHQHSTCAVLERQLTFHSCYFTRHIFRAANRLCLCPALIGASANPNKATDGYPPSLLVSLESFVN